MFRFKSIIIQLMALVGLLSTTKAAIPQANEPSTGRKKVALVLAGGGAKGMAYIGALKVLDEVGIPVDLVVGTSVGGIVGGMYAIGYTPAQMDSVARTVECTTLLSGRTERRMQNQSDRALAERYVFSMPIGEEADKDAVSGLLKGKNITDLLSRLTIGYHGSVDFNKLPIPFTCVAQDIVSGNEVTFHGGDIVTAMRASMAVPALFTPVRKDSMLLVDGAMVNIYPADVARRMGADIVIGLDVQADMRPADNLTNAYTIAEQVINLFSANRYRRNVAESDAYIKVNVDGYYLVSFTSTSIDALIQRGEDAARSQMGMLKELRKTIYGSANAATAANTATTSRQPYPYTHDSKLLLREIRVDYYTDWDMRWLMERCNLRENSEVSIADIERAKEMLCSHMEYANATYTLPQHPDGGFILEFHMSRKQEDRVNIGLRFDSEETASVIGNITHSLKNSEIPTLLSLSARFGKRIAVEAGAALEASPLNTVKLSYRFEHNDIDITKLGTHTHTAVFNYHKAEAEYANTWFRNVRIAGGIRYELFDFDNILYREGSIMADNTDNENLFSAFAQADYDTYDHAYFPMDGISAHADYAVYTDDMFEYKDGKPFSAASMHVGIAYPLTPSLSLLPEAYMRTIFGKEVATAKRNCMGGDVAGRYFQQQLPFTGINNVEMTHNTLGIASLKIRQRMGTIHYLTLTTNYSLNAPKVVNLFKGRALFGCGISYGLDSVVGPLECSLNYMNHSNAASVYVNLGYKF